MYEEVERCLTRSNVIECDTDDHVLKKGGAARNIFVVLDGTLEVRDGPRLVGVLSRGDVFGEIVVRHLGVRDPRSIFPGYPVDAARFPGLFA